MNRKLFLLFVVMLAAVVLPARWAAAEPSATSSSFIPGEPNDTFDTANEAYSGYLMTPADVDFLRVELGTAYRLQPHVFMYTEYNDPPAVLRVELALYDAGQNLLAQDTNCDEAMELPDHYVPAGLYYLRLRACAGAFDGDQLYTADLFGYSYPIEWEPNNSRATANPFGGNDATIQPAGDVDFYRFEGMAGEHWYAHLWTNDDDMNPEIALMNADGTVLATSGPGYLHYDLTADGTYYFRVRSTSGSVGEYGLYGEGEWPVAPNPHDVEPNNTPAQAVPTELSAYINGEVSSTDTIDYYRFQGQAGDRIALPETEDFYNPGYVPFLYDAALNPIPLSGYTRWASLPVTGDYYLAFAIDPPATYGGYWVYLVLLSEGEPNDTIETAIPVVVGQTVEFVSDFPCDMDWYRFQGRAGDVFPNVHPYDNDDQPRLLAADGSPIYGVEVLPADGVYFLATAPTIYDGYDAERDCIDWDDTLRVGEALWVSAAANGLGGNAAITQGDIVTRKTAANQWQIVFDGSDVGITKNVTAFERLPNGSILMSLAAAQTVPGLGKVMPQDIIQFLPTSLGDTTAGTFQWYLDGSDVGLTTAGEKIDAILMFRDIENPLRISTAGTGSAPKYNGGTLKWADEDIINFVGAAYGANSAGAWRMHLNGSDVPGLAAEDVNAATRVELYPQHESYLLLSMATNFVINGNAGTPLDVVIGGTWQSATWQTAVQRLTDKKIDGLAIGPAWMP